VSEVNGPDPETGILVVEDEDMLRAAVSKLLRRRGFSVMEANDGTSAVDLLRAHGNRIAVVLLDVTLPGRPSHEVLEAAYRVREDIKVIVTSAYGPNIVAGQFPGVQVDHFIRKPYRVAELVDMVRGVMADSVT